MKKIIIAIDGYSGCGKSTSAKILAAQLGYIYIDTGAMYRAVTLYFLDNYIEITNPKKIQKALSEIEITFRDNPQTQHSDTYLNGLNVEDKIRSMRVTQMVSQVSTVPEVRKALVEQQQNFGKKRGIVMDGRDIGTTVFPDAELKIFMSASVEVKALRRQQELLTKDELVDLNTIRENLIKRDFIDTTREESPLQMAKEAIPVDTTNMSIDETVEFIITLATSQIIKENT